MWVPPKFFWRPGRVSFQLLINLFVANLCFPKGSSSYGVSLSAVWCNYNFPLKCFVAPGIPAPFHDTVVSTHFGIVCYAYKKTGDQTVQHPDSHMVTDCSAD